MITKRAIVQGIEKEEDIPGPKGILDKHPFLALGGAAALGLTGAGLMAYVLRKVAPTMVRNVVGTFYAPVPAAPSWVARAKAVKPQAGDLLRDVGALFRSARGEGSKLGGTAIDALMNRVQAADTTALRGAVRNIIGKAPPADMDPMNFLFSNT